MMYGVPKVYAGSNASNVNLNYDNSVELAKDKESVKGLTSPIVLDPLINFDINSNKHRCLPSKTGSIPKLHSLESAFNVVSIDGNQIDTDYLSCCELLAQCINLRPKYKTLPVLKPISRPSALEMRNGVYCIDGMDVQRCKVVRIYNRYEEGIRTNGRMGLH